MIDDHSTSFWQHSISEHWGIQSRLEKLEGEFDLNFLAIAEDGTGYVLKVMHPGCEAVLVDLQIKALSHLKGLDAALLLPNVIPANDGQPVQRIKDPDGAERLVWMLERLPGRCYAELTTKSPDLICDLGRELGRIARGLSTFEHPGLARDFKWNLVQADWVKPKLDCITNAARRALLEDICAGFDTAKSALSAMPVQAIHNDANDYNVLVQSYAAQMPKLTGVIDLGDLCAAPRICDLAIAGAYVVLDHPDPAIALSALVAGFHEANPLSLEEVELVWPLLRMRLAVSVVISTLMAVDAPDDPYVTISQAPAWRFLEREDLSGDLLTARLRVVCGMPAVNGADRVMAWLDQERGNFAPIMGCDLNDAPMGSR